MFFFITVIMNATSCGLKHVAQHYMTLQCGAGRRISGVCKHLYFFFGTHEIKVVPKCPLASSCLAAHMHVKIRYSMKVNHTKFSTEDVYKTLIIHSSSG